MNLLDTLQKALGGNASGSGFPGLSGNSAGNGLSGLFSNSSSLLGPAALGGLLGALLTSKTARGVAGGALLAGGGALLWDKYKDLILKKNADNPQYSGQPSGTRERAERLIRAMVFAAKSDGTMDAAERTAITQELKKLQLDSGSEAVIRSAMEEPLDPQRLASEVTTADEALELYAMSLAVITPDHFMERSYLDALAKALNIPEEVQKDIEGKLRASA